MSLLTWFPLQGDLTNKGLLADIITPTFTNITYSNSGILGQCLERGSLHITAEQAKSLFHKTISIAFWIFPIEGSGSTAIFGNNITMTPPNNRKFTLFQYPDYKTLHWSWQDNDSSSTYAGGTTALLENQWNHVVVTQDEINNKVCIYVNGEKKATNTPNPSIKNRTITFENATTLLHDSALNKLCDLRIYNHALEPREVKELAKGLLVHYAFNDIACLANVFDAKSYITSYLHNCTVASYGHNGFSFTSTGSDPWIGSAMSANSTLSNGIAFPVRPNTEYCLSWTHVNGSELNKNYVSFLNSSSQALAAYTSLGSPQSTGTTRYEIFTTPVGAEKIHFRFGNGNLAANETITIEDLSLRPGNIPAYTPPHAGGYISDGSGYNNHAIIQNKCLPINEQGQGLYSLRTYGHTTGSTLAESSYVKGNLPTTITPAAFTISFCAKLNDWGVQTSGILSLSNSATNPTDYMDSTVAQYDGKFQLNAAGGSTNYSLSTSIIVKGEWHHYAFRWNGATWESFRDGTKIQSVNAAITPDSFRYIYLGLNAAGGAYRDSDVTWGDFKLYMTALSDDEILKEAQFTQRILKDGSSQVVSVNEIDTDHSCVTRAGVNNINYLSEILELDDGSCWIQLSHHNNRAKVNRFSSSDDFAHKFVYHNDECWSAFHLISSHGLYNSRYEFMAIENIGTTDNFEVHRWTQTKNPLTASYADVQPGSANVVYNSNYNIPTINGGMYKLNSNTFFCITNATNGNWFGAFGAWNWHGDGIPTFQNRSTSGILDLYMRIDPASKLYKEFKKGITMPITINEI